MTCENSVVDILVQQLGYADTPNLFLLDGDDELAFGFLAQARAKLGACAAVVDRSESDTVFPLIYFCSLETYSPDRISYLHRLAWNLSGAPLLFVVLPTEVRVYSSYRHGVTETGFKWDADRALLDKLVLSHETMRFVGDIDWYSRESVLSGALWRSKGKWFDHRSRVDEMLLSNLEALRTSLFEMGLDSSTVHSLIGRSILVSYLEQRRDKDGYNAFPAGFFDGFLKGVHSFHEVLSDKEAAYEMFDYLAAKFNGDVFPVGVEERRVVCPAHLTRLQQFLTGQVDLATNQYALWPFYSFDVIPITLLSSIYESFLEQSDTRQDLGVHYTPSAIVEFLMDQVLPWAGGPTEPKILDPACGSGAFLVEAYRRVVERFARARRDELSTSVLKRLLRKCIFGVDLMDDAIRVTALGLYLTMCDYLEPRYIWSRVHFPSLIETNLIASDYFDVQFSNRFDIVIGNPPWYNDLTKPARRYVEKRMLPVGDLQIAQAFMWKAVEDCKDAGRVCLLVPRGVQFNRSRTNREFQSEFLKRIRLRLAVNFALMRFDLFKNSVAPAMAIVYSPMQPAREAEIASVVYCTLKPIGNVSDSWSLPLRTLEVTTFSQERFKDETLWKAAMWGTPRDLNLVERLRTLPTLANLIDDHGWTSGEGYIQGGRKYVDDPKWHVPEFLGQPVVDPRRFRPFRIYPQDLRIMNVAYFHRARTERLIYEAPHLLVRQSPKVRKGFEAALLDQDALFSQSFLGIHATKDDIGLLAAVCVLLCSDLATYLMMLTSSRWLVERGEAEANEILNLPISPHLLTAHLTPADLDRLAQDKGARLTATRLVEEWYGLNAVERDLVRNLVTFEWDYFLRRGRSIGFSRVDRDDLERYIDAIGAVLEKSFSQAFECRAILGSFPLALVSITPGPSGVRTVTESPERLSALLNTLDRKQTLPGLYGRTGLIIYEGQTVYVCKPALKYFWTTSRAMQDADRVYADIMSSWDGGR